MNARTKTILLALALVSATAALQTQAADQSAFFEQQLEQTDGGSAHYTGAPAVTKAETTHQLAEDDWFAAERNRGGSASLKPVPFPIPSATVTASVSPATRHQAAENDWLTKERDETDGNTAPVPFRERITTTTAAGE